MFCFRIRAQETRKPCYLILVLFQDTSSGDLYALLVCFMFGFRIRAQETRKPCYLILVLFQDMNSGSS